MSTVNPKIPPSTCPYSGGSCDQSYDGMQGARAIFLYPNEVAAISNTIESAVSKLAIKHPKLIWRTWKDFKIHGHIIFCEICKNIRFADIIFADVTTVNFNLFFEVGYAIRV